MANGVITSPANPEIIRGRIWSWHGVLISAHGAYITRGGNAYRASYLGVPILMSAEFALALV